jgi:hypothetical protein
MERDKLKIATPCPKDFDEMHGDGFKRFCDHCQKHVHNLSDLTRRDALALLKENRNSRICVVYTFDEREQVVFRDDVVLPRPPKKQLAGIRRLLAAAAVVPILATLPACDTAPAEPEVIITDDKPCGLAMERSYTPLDEILEAEERFVDAIKELLGFVPEYEIVAGEPMVDPIVYERDEPPPEPVIDTPPPMIMGDIAVSEDLFDGTND